VGGHVVGYHAHNLFLAQAFYGGAVGALLWLAVFVLSFRAAAGTWRASGDFLPLLGLSFLFIVGMVDIGPVIVDVQAIWLYVWIVLGVVLSYDTAARGALRARVPGADATSA
jgi:O-antigen ligase